MAMIGTSFIHLLEWLIREERAQQILVDNRAWSWRVLLFVVALLEFVCCLGGIEDRRLFWRNETS